MRTIIKIDRSTIRKNPEYGVPERREYAGELWATFTLKNNSEDVTWDGNNPIPKLPDGFPKTGFVVTSFYDDGTTAVFECWSKGPEVPQAFIEKGLAIEGMTMSLSRDVVGFQGEPFPQKEFLYEYEDTKIECNECGEMIRHQDIDYDYCDCGCCYRSGVCPECNEEDCFDIEYEKFTESMI